MLGHGFCVALDLVTVGTQKLVGPCIKSSEYLFVIGKEIRGFFAVLCATILHVVDMEGSPIRKPTLCTFSAKFFDNLLADFAPGVDVIGVILGFPFTRVSSFAGLRVGPTLLSMCCVILFVILAQLCSVAVSPTFITVECCLRCFSHRVIISVTVNEFNNGCGLL